MVLLDGSKTAECALGHVSDIAKGCNVPEVILLSVVEPLPGGLYQARDEVRGKLEAWIQTYLAGVEKSLVKDGISARSVVIGGKAAETIVDYAERNGIDLIIMSTHGRSGPTRWAFGSVADKVIRSSNVPVLLVSPEGCRIG